MLFGAPLIPPLSRADYGPGAWHFWWLAECECWWAGGISCILSKTGYVHWIPLISCKTTGRALCWMFDFVTFSLRVSSAKLQEDVEPLFYLFQDFHLQSPEPECLLTALKCYIFSSTTFFFFPEWAAEHTRAWCQAEEINANQSLN